MNPAGFIGLYLFKKLLRMKKQDIDFKEFCNEYEALISFMKQGLISDEFEVSYPDTDVGVKLTDDFAIAITPVINSKLDHLYIRAIYIREHARGNGFGTQIMLYLIDLVKDSTVDSIQVEPYDSSILFFEKFGFQMMQGKDNNRMILKLKKLAD